MKYLIIIMCLMLIGCAKKYLEVPADQGLQLFGIYPNPVEKAKVMEFDNQIQENILNVVCDKCEGENIDVTVKVGRCSWGKGKQKMSEYSPITMSCTVYHGSTYYFKCNDCGYEVISYK